MGDYNPKLCNLLCLTKLAYSIAVKADSLSVDCQQI